MRFGSVAAGGNLPPYPELFRAAIDVLAPLAVRLLVTVGDAERDVGELGTLASNVDVETWVRHDHAAAAVDVVVCQAGSVPLSARSPGARLSWLCRCSAPTNGRTVPPLLARGPA